jgi:signal transduction histidine kinase
MPKIFAGLLLLFRKVSNLGVASEFSEHLKFRQRSINSFCLFCMACSTPHYFVFYMHGVYKLVGVIFFIHVCFVSVLIANSYRKFWLANIVLVFVTNFSVMSLSLMLGFSTGFHLYIFVVPLFVFWLFDKQDLPFIIATSFLYICLYLFTVYHGNHYFPIYRVHFNAFGLSFYDMNALLALILLFLLFYNYFAYHKLLTNDLLDKQRKLESEVKMRKESEGNAIKLFDDLSVSYKNLEQFNYIVSHNMRAPLANIKGFVSLYDKTNPENPQNNTIITYVETAANHLDEILADLNYILKNKERAHENKEEMLFKSLVDNVTWSLINEINETSAVVRVECQNGASIYSIKSGVVNILYNLIQNAVKYRQNFTSPHIVVSLDSSDAFFDIIKVQDNGIGIDLEKHRERIFKLYSRLHRNVDGKGMGLYLVKTHVDMLGGKIEVFSTLNVGTTFVIQIPKQ